MFGYGSPANDWSASAPTTPLYSGEEIHEGLSFTYMRFRLNRIGQISLATKDDGVRLHERQDNRDDCEGHQATLDWPTPTDYAPPQNDFSTQQQEGTGQRLLDSAEFYASVGTDKQKLNCPGIPEARKTFLTAVVLVSLLRDFSTTRQLALCTFTVTFGGTTSRRSIAF
jgi:hypothetical protein